MAEYRSSEGKAVILPYKGQIKDTVSDILGGIRSTCTYVGARWVQGVCVVFCFDFVIVYQFQFIYGARNLLI